MINEESLKTRVLERRIEAHCKLPLAPELVQQFKDAYEHINRATYWQEDSHPWQETGRYVRSLSNGALKSFLVMQIREIQRMIPDDFIDFLEADNTTLRNEILNRVGAEMQQYNYIGLLLEEIELLRSTVRKFEGEQS